MTRIPFVKAHGCGNDFLMIESDYAPTDLARVTRALCDRHKGVGADGVEWIHRGASDHDVIARLVNSDGSEAEISGNGTRCVAAYWTDKHGGEQVRIKTGAGVKTCCLKDRHDSRFTFEMGMGAPAIGEELKFEDVQGQVVSMGNPHFVVFVESFDRPWQREGAMVQAQPAFASGTNVEFVRVKNQNEIEARFFERGAGETHSSGTGSCASAVAAIHKEMAKSPVKVAAPGGAQTVRWDGDVFLTGEAEIVCSGEFYLNLAIG
ncbi:MAG: diaminopimelate epimerase [Acidobacteriales bacterium]|nr:diaminopimelate epimerase [Terriglobales bacterium]